MPGVTMPAGLLPVGFQQITLTNSTAVAINSTCRKSSMLHISVETQAARYRMDGTAPTKNTGVVLQKDQTVWIEGYNGTSQLYFQRTTGTCKISLMAYGHRGYDR